MPLYKRLKKNVFEKGNYKIVPLRDEDKLLIMQWRNEQIYHLRQAKPLTEAAQKEYFTNVVSPLFNEEAPGQVLFSYLEKETCIGYGGLVHINWVDKHAEISFVMNTGIEKLSFEFHWASFLELIEEVAFSELELHKIFTYAFDLRPRLYEVLEKRNYTREARLQEHCLFEGKFIDVVIHSKINSVC
jgi:RimJ/RimL family protein N-acetyltransferase